MSSPATYQYDPGETVTFTLDNTVQFLAGDGQPQTMFCSVVPGTPFSYARRGEGPHLINFFSGWMDYDLANVPTGALSLSPGDAWEPDVVTWDMAAADYNFNSAPPYDFSGWQAFLSFAPSYTSFPPSGNIIDKADTYLVRFASDSSSLIATTPTAATAIGAAVYVNHSLYLGKAPYVDGPYGRHDPVYGQTATGWRFFVVPFGYQTARMGPAAPSFYIASHWVIKTISPITVVQGDPTPITLSLHPPLHFPPVQSGFDANFYGAVFLIDSEMSTDPFSGPPFVPPTFGDAQEQFLEQLSQGAASIANWGFTTAPSLSTGTVDQFNTVVIAVRLGEYPPLPVGDLHIRYRVEYATQRRVADPSFGPSTTFHYSHLIYDDGPQYLDVTVTPRPSGGGTVTPDPRDVGDGRDTAQDAATGRITRVRSVAEGAGSTSAVPAFALQSSAWEGWQNLSGVQPRTPGLIRTGPSGNVVQGQFPSLWKSSEEGRYSLCYQNLFGAVVRADSLDSLLTLMPFPTTIFRTSGGQPMTGGRPVHIQDGSTGIYYIAASFALLDSTGKPNGTEDVLIARVGPSGPPLPWADGTTQKYVVRGTAAAGRPALVLNRYDPEQPILLLHGDRKFDGKLGGEQWVEIQ